MASEREIFDRALAIDEARERTEYLRQACGQDEALREHIEGLLQAHAKLGEFLEHPPFADEDPTVDQSLVEGPGAVVGPYRLLQKIGEGGFGLVYMAEQAEPVERRVALKIIKPGMDSRQVIARFEAEEQALAMMDHPNIARVFDAGITDSGRPYFVMELVKGVPITAYCDQRHLTPRERLELFIPVCRAVQHAHQKGIIHRDLKPSNVLIALYDGKPVPKVIDFGVAKATSQRLTERTMFTQYGQIVGTLEYMSPEQANLNQLDIDTRSDIYSLGVLLYELLTGETPFDRRRLRSAAFDELLRIIREEEPPRPSMRLSTSETLPSIAANRQIEPKKLSTLVRGELDWIVMKALEKDRSRRYETANGLADDIERYLHDEPVAACPPSAVYRFRKFARRNRVPLAVVSAAVLVLVSVAIGAGLAAARFRDLARRNADLATAKQTALTSAITAEKAATKACDQEAAERAEAQRQRGLAEANYSLARSSVDKFLNRVTENELLTVPGFRELATCYANPGNGIRLNTDAGVVTDAELSAVILGHNDRQAVRKYLQQLVGTLRSRDRLAEQWRSPESRSTSSSVLHAVRGIAAFGDGDLLTKELLARAESIFAEKKGGAQERLVCRLPGNGALLPWSLCRSSLGP